MEKKIGLEKDKEKNNEKRGYYTELATDENFQARKTNITTKKKPNFIWEIVTDKNAPTIPDLKAAKRARYLAPAERWMCYDEEKTISFPVDVFKPKVQLQHFVDPFKIPRNVQIERKMRQYQRQDIRLCLKELNIKHADILPVDVIKKYWDGVHFGLFKMIHWLPLEWFDDEDFCSRSPEGWLDHGIMDGVRHPIPAQAFLPKAVIKPTKGDRMEKLFEWTNVAVLDFNKDMKKYKLLTLDGLKREFYLAEIYILFKAEEPMKCAKRIQSALEMRNAAEIRIRYEFIMDCMEVTGTYEIPEEWVEKFISLAFCGKVNKIVDASVVEALKDEIQLNHKRSLGEMQFRQSVLAYPDMYKFIKLPQQETEIVKEYGRVDIDLNNYKAKAEYFRWYSIFVMPQSLMAISQVVLECLKVKQMNLFTTNYGKIVTLEEFETAQNKFTSHCMKYLKYTWIDATCFNLRWCLGEVGKGWFDINERTHNVYDIAKLTRLFECVKYRMQYALRILVEHSVALFTNLIEVPCQSSLDVPDDYVWDSNFIDSPFPSKTTPIFYMQLKISEAAVYFSTDLAAFSKTLLRMYDSAIIGTHSIKQVHPMLLVKLKFPNDLYLSSVGLLDYYVCEMRERFLLGYNKAVIPVQAYAKTYEIFMEFYNMNMNAYLLNFKEEQHTAGEVKDEVSNHLKMRDHLEEILPSLIVIGPFSISVDNIRQNLIQKRMDLAKKLLDQFADKMKNLFIDIIHEFEDLLRKLQEKPHSIEHIYDIKDWMETIPMTVRALEDSTKRYLLEYDILDFFWYNLPQEDFEAKWETVGWPLRISKQIDDTNDFLIEETDKFYKIQQNDEQSLIEKIEALTVQITTMYSLRDASKCHEIAIDMKRAWKAMKEAQEYGQLLNSRQKLFLVTVVPFDTLTKLIKEFEPYKNLWVTASDWLKYYDIWMDNPLANIDGEAIERLVTDMYKTMVKSIRVFADIPGVQQVAADIRDKIDDFKPLIPLIQGIRNPGMKQRHWDAFAEETGIVIPWTANTTFQDCLDIDVDKHIDVVIKISDNAGKEYAIELTLDKMVAEWEVNMLELTPFKTSGTYIMKVSDDIQQMLDDHIVLTQQLSFSPFKAALTERIDLWENMLKITYDVIEEWMDVQKQWMYLEPIFTSADISKQLPVESKKYNSMERTWRRIMRSAYESPKIIDYCSDKKLLESLRDANHILEVVQKGLADYLEVKRMTFPRLFFLSDDELLEILSQARNPLAVQPHLRKCFENVARLNFEKDLKITQMFSAEDECVDLNPTLYPTSNVEDWLLVVEGSMKNTVRSIFGDSLKDMPIKPRDQWVLEWPGQIVIAGCQTFWTSGVENGISTNRMPEFFDELLRNLDLLRGLVKGSLTFLQREVLSALIVIEVHARDVTQLLVDGKISNVNDFDWISQLRYYWVNDEHLKVRAVNAEFQYGYEYLGNSGRLVITPLTDRCYLTLTGALHLKFGGAPAGPAGTGKTETTKDLGKAFAIQCVVFNCSDQLDFMAMGKFFKGLASSGAWACFDEFNRIDIEVLSVVAQQIMTIQKAQQSRQDRFMFEGCDIALKESCAVFITMNPGYAGRTELPDNLKALFRPVAMMVPNYSLIAEISLFSFGFGNAKQLANKITTTFKLSSEQLSSQDHYDFGMRAVKTVIAVAGNLKREKPLMDERQIVLRSLRDVNVPKFLKDDLKLFNGIVSDLFPRMVEEEVDYGVLEESIRICSINLGLEDVDEYVRKVIQLYETTVVRHGLMLVGPTGSGKTKCYEILKDAMTLLRGKPSPSGYPFQSVHTYVLNPKSITMGQLYGEFDMQTHEWTDGILPCLVRVGVACEDKDKRWYVFDGPVDAVWIENMNTVLDDNKKLCLSSGEIIKLRDTQTMMFEVADLAVASPATVSRCGMVYLEPGVLGLPPYLNCWLRRLPPLAVDFAPQFQELFNQYMYPAIALVRGHLRELLVSVDSALVTCFLNLLDFRLGPLAGRDNKPPPPAPFLKLIPELIFPWVIFSLLWSIGATCDNDGRVIFNKWLREKMTSLKHKPAMPNEGMVYDYKLHDGGFTDATADGEPAKPSWRHWMENVEEYKITVDMKYSDIEVPTIDKIRNAELVGILLYNENNVICVGPTGTGKSLTVIGKLGNNMHKKFICDFFSFSARTTANQTQDLIDSKLDRRRKGVFGPPLLKRQVFFIDDFNMPALEVYGAQPPIELIRQWMDFSGWYDRKSIGDFRTIIDINFVGAMGPPGGGRNQITARLLRHFHYICFLELEDTSKRQIYGKILKFWLDRTPGYYTFYESMLTETLSVYTTILRELLPTPAKTHYTFNMRDLSKVFEGILMKDPESIKTVEEIIRLWYHENCRVFQDRLVNDEDRNWFDALLKSKIEYFRYKISDCLGEEELLFCDFLDPHIDVRQYDFVADSEKLTDVLYHYLRDYNSQTTSPMRLVLFNYAISHVCRIARIIRQPKGNALLLGVGGSGRQSLTRLAAHIGEFYCFQIELSKAYSLFDWKEDIKGLMLKAGLHKRETVFLFSDTQIKSETFLEDLNNILNSGDVPNIYQPEELDKIYQGLKGTLTEMGLTATKSNLFAVYQRLVRSNLHTVITMSPIGEVFRSRIRQFPAFVNCCTIDWFSAWPNTALLSVATQFLEEIPELSVTDDVRYGIAMVCQIMHASVVTASHWYFQELSRYNYVTPTSYLQLLSSYTDLMAKQKGELMEGIGRLEIGLDKLQSTAEETTFLQKHLEVLKPALEIAAKEAEIMIEQIAKDTLVAEETKVIVEHEEAAAEKKKSETETIAQDAERDLEAAMPALLAAEKSLQSLNKNDITEVRAMKRPPTGVIYVIEAICIVKNVKPNKVPGLKPGEKLNDYWEPGRAMLTDPGAFLVSLMNFDKDSITEDMINKLKSYVEDPQFQPQKIIKVSKACTSLCMWVHAMYKYYFVNMQVAPKKAALAQANTELALTEAALAGAKAKMKAVMDGLELLQEKLAARIAYKEEQESNINMCQERMNRAIRLITGLADEKIRWIDTIKNINLNMVNVTGDILICSGTVAYLTPFTDKYRRRLLAKWMRELRLYNVPHSPTCDPVLILGEPVLIRQWQIEGLPRDSLSTENAVLVSRSKRWPLFIDPQGQANKWIKNMGKTRGIAICKLADKDLIRTLELSIRFGKPVLIENVGVELDPALDPVLLRLIFKQGNTNMLKIGDSIVPYNDEFQLYITTKLANPHYTPEVSVKVQLVNFTLVPSGLQDQLLALVVLQERPDLEEQRSQIIVGSAQMKQELKDIQDRILHKLSTSEGSPLDDIDFIVALEASKVKSEDIKSKVESAEITQIDIDNTRAQYIPVANRGQILYFCVSDLSNVDPMYQYSLEWFIAIFVNAMAETEKTDDLNERVAIINDHFTYSLYTNVCRSLFEKHKLLFAFLLCVRMLMDTKEIFPNEWHHFLAGGSPTLDMENPASSWLSEKAWMEILSLNNLDHFQEFVNTFPSNVGTYKYIFESPEPHREQLPKIFRGKLDEFQKLIILKSLRPDKLTNGMQDFLTEKMGERFVEPQATDLSAMYKESSPLIPLIFVLSTGTDPAADLYKFADRMKMSKRMMSISLGQGQGPRAEKMIQEGSEIGSWVFFQNCHLAPSFMPRLERVIEQIPIDTVHREFRIWLTSTPSPAFPVSILQNGSKMTIEPPSGLKANMLRAYLNQVSDLSDYFHSEHEKVFTFKWLLFSLCMFHGCLLERRKFGPLGFNIPYEFTDGDLKICISQLYMFLMEYTEVPFKVLIYTAGHINYGGRVTDDWDRRCLMNVLTDYYKTDVINVHYAFDDHGFYHQLPGDTPLIDYMDYIRSFPLNDDPALFGLHKNADISCAQAVSYTCLSTLLKLQPKEIGGSATSQEDVTAKVSKNILKDIPPQFDVDKILELYPVTYTESLNTVIVQEAIRYNKLLQIIVSTLNDLLKAIKGLVVMSEALEQMSRSLFSNMVPAKWASKAYPSLKPLGAWVKDLNDRIAFLNKWVLEGIPPVFWISGFYFPQAFLTGTLQNYARKYVLSIDCIGFSFKVLKNHPTERAADGCCIFGLYIEGCRWNKAKEILDESNPKELYTEMPAIWLIPEENHKKPAYGVYECPVYKTLTRAGTLSTTGHSTNYVLAIEVPSSKLEKHWIQRGVALICALDY